MVKGRAEIISAVVFGLFCLQASAAATPDEKTEELQKTIINNQMAIKHLLETVSEMKKRTSCTAPFFGVNSDCFLLFTDGYTWQEAVDTCKLAGGSLAQPRNPFVLTQYLRQQNAGNPDWASYYWWIGGRYAEHQSWAWNSGMAIPDAHWSTDHPATSSNDTCLNLRLVLPPLGAEDCQAKRQMLCQF